MQVIDFYCKNLFNPIIIFKEVFSQIPKTSENEFHNSIGDSQIISLTSKYPTIFFTGYVELMKIFQHLV